jgi:hypothetical protein
MHSDNSKNDMDIHEKGGGMELPEIGIPTNELSVSIELLPTSPSRIKMMPTIEVRQKGNPSEHT